MNDPEVTMPNQLIAHSTALEAAGLALALAGQVPAPLRCLAEQLVRAASSVPANLSEGHGRTGRDRLHHWRIAHGSLEEARTALRVAEALGYLRLDSLRPALQLVDRTVGLVWGLVH